MDVTSNASKRNALTAVIQIVCRTFLITVLIPLHAYSQCNPDAAGWLVKLALIEDAHAETKEKIRLLSAVKKDFEKCRLPKDSVYARIIHRLGDLYRISGDYERGIQLTSEAISVNKGNTPGAQKSYLTHSYYNLGLYHNLLGLSADAHQYYDSCIEVGLAFPEKRFIALMAMEKKAFLYFHDGDYEQGIRLSERGVMIARQQNLPEYEALLLIQKAQCQSELNRISDAGKNVSQAITILNSHHLGYYLPNAYSVYALVLSREKQFEEAISYYTKAFDLNLAEGNVAQAARDLHDLGFLFDKELNDYKQAMACYSRALEVLEMLKDPYMRAATYNNLGQLCWRTNDFETALGYYQKGLKALPIAFQDDDTRINPTMSSLREVNNEYIAAALLWNKGDAWLGLYNSSKNKAFLKHALATYRAGDRMVDQMRWKQQGEQSKLFWRQKTKGWYQNAIDASYLDGSAEDAFHFMEKSRAVLLNDKLAELGAKNQLPPTDAETEKALRMKLQTLVGRASANPDDGRLADELWQVQHKLNKFIKELEKKYPLYYTYKYDTTVYSMSDLQQMLAQGDLSWVELFTTENSIFALTITSGDAKLDKIHFNEHAKTAKQIMDLCSSRSVINRNFREYHGLSYLYHKTVFKPLNISTRRVIVSHDEYFIPFDLLQTDSVDDRSFLLKKHAFSYAYSAAHVLRNKTGYPSPSQSLLAIAPVKYKSYLQLQDLHGADQSLEKIRSLYNGGVIFTGKAATKQTFLREISSATVVHFYSHAKADSLGQEPTIYLYDSALELSELQNLAKLDTELIVLFACNTGVGKAIKGEGIFSLARGFAAAGIPSTISALWEIDNQATYHLAEFFFKELAKGESSDVALQKAKLDMTNRDAYALPYYWAGAVLIGKPDIYHSDGKASSIDFQYIVLLGLMSILAAIFFIMFKKKRISRKPEKVY